MKDKLAEHARKPKVLSDGVTTVKHCASCLPFSDIDKEGIFTAQDGKRHKASDFDWENGRYLV